MNELKFYNLNLENKTAKGKSGILMLSVFLKYRSDNLKYWAFFFSLFQLRPTIAGSHEFDRTFSARILVIFGVFVTRTKNYFYSLSAEEKGEKEFRCCSYSSALLRRRAAILNGSVIEDEGKGRGRGDGGKGGGCKWKFLLITILFIEKILRIK